MAKIKFKKDTVLSYDGFNTRTYKAGEVYEANHAHEARMFDAFVRKGEATEADKPEVTVEKSPKTTRKVRKPRATK